MGGKREKSEDIVLKLRQVEVLQGQGKPLADAVDLSRYIIPTALIIDLYPISFGD